jgi:hypothetical protein
MDKLVNAKLIDAAIEQMKVDMAANDWTAIEGLLYGVAFEKLKSYIPEDEEEDADNLDQAHYKAICKFGTDIALINCRELKS